MQHILSAGVVVARAVPEGWRLLMLRVYNYWDFPKGLVEPGEEPLAAARREVREETGLGDLDFRWGEDFIETAPYSKNKIARYYLASTSTERVELPVNPELGVPEHHEFRWLERAEASPLLVPRVRAVLEWASARLARADLPP